METATENKVPTATNEQLLNICREEFKKFPKPRNETIKNLAGQFKMPFRKLRFKIRRIFSKLTCEKRAAKLSRAKVSEPENFQNMGQEEFTKKLKGATEELVWDCPFPKKVDLMELYDRLQQS